MAANELSCMGRGSTKHFLWMARKNIIRARPPNMSKNYEKWAPNESACDPDQYTHTESKAGQCSHKTINVEVDFLYHTWTIKNVWHLMYIKFCKYLLFNCILVVNIRILFVSNSSFFMLIDIQLVVLIKSLWIMQVWLRTSDKKKKKL